MPIIVVFLLVLTFSQARAADDVVDLIRKGEIDEARRLLESSSSASRRDGDILFARALIESDGRKAYQLLETAENSAVNPKYKEEIVFLKTNYFLLLKDYKAAALAAAEYLENWENGKYRPTAMRLAAIAYKNAGQSEKADRFIARMLKENSETGIGAVGWLDQGNALYEAQKYGEAAKIFNNLSKSKEDAIAAPALYMNVRCAIKRGKLDDAIFQFNMFKEEYPNAIGIDDLMDDLTSNEKASDDSRAEKITGTTYAVQAGVFSNKDNAKTLARRLKQYGEAVDIADKVISGKKYYVVYAGRFVSIEKAMAFKARLELSEKETFQVIAR
jgi:TolA-binding protein